MADASPLKWHLAHTTWFFETFVLKPFLTGYRPPHPAYEALFNSYYETVGQPFARAQRGLLTRPSLAEVMAWRAHVDAALAALIESAPHAEVEQRIDLGLHHEQQHQELMLTDLKHLLAQNPLQPAYREGPAAPEAAQPSRWLACPGGIAALGAEGEGFAFDNERPRHRVLLASFAIASRPVSNGEFRDFVRDRGYRRAELWLADGWQAVNAQGWRRPLYWAPDLESAFTLRGPQPLDAHAPVCHLSYYEADAFARWAGARLPTEFEWEHAASGANAGGLGGGAAAGQFAEDGALEPRVTASLLGSVWVWTASAYTAYPGFRAAAGALGEYNGKFMCGQWVLRGGSFATPGDHIRPSYRNFFPPAARWQFSGLRLAKDAG